MRRLLPIIFGISTALSPLCTMAYAQGHGAMMTHAAACESSGKHDASTMCKEDDASSTMFHSQTPCADGSCFIHSAAQEHNALSPDILSFLTVASLPPVLDTPVMQDRTVEPIEEQTANRPPPDNLSSVVLLE